MLIPRVIQLMNLLKRLLRRRDKQLKVCWEIELLKSDCLGRPCRIEVESFEIVSNYRPNATVYLACNDVWGSVRIGGRSHASEHLIGAKLTARVRGHRIFTGFVGNISLSQTANSIRMRAQPRPEIEQLLKQALRRP